MYILQVVSTDHPILYDVSITQVVEKGEKGGQGGQRGLFDLDKIQLDIGGSISDLSTIKIPNGGQMVESAQAITIIVYENTQGGLVVFDDVTHKCRVYSSISISVFVKMLSDLCGYTVQVYKAVYEFSADSGLQRKNQNGMFVMPYGSSSSAAVAGQVDGSASGSASQVTSKPVPKMYQKSGVIPIHFEKVYGSEIESSLSGRIETEKEGSRERNREDGVMNGVEEGTEEEQLSRMEKRYLQELRKDFYVNALTKKKPEIVTKIKTKKEKKRWIFW